jgi:hypothetical protein
MAYAMNAYVETAIAGDTIPRTIASQIYSDGCWFQGKVQIGLSVSIFAYITALSNPLK